MTKPNLAAGYHNTHGCCCCALLRRADYSPVSRQPHHRHPASEHRDHGRTAGTCGSTPRLQTSIKKQDPVRRKTAAMVRLLEQNLYCITSFINSHLCKVSAYNKMYACTPANISLRAYHDTETLTTVKFILDLTWRMKRGAVKARTGMRTQDPRLAQHCDLGSAFTELAAKDRTKERLVSA